MKKKGYLILILGFLNLSLNAQTITFKGKVTDSIQNPMPYANVLAKPADKTKNLQFAITDEEGYYKLKLTAKETYEISISYMGYKSINFSITPNADTVKNFVLHEDPNQLEEVVIEMPIVVKGDSTIYNTEKFVTGEERKLKNVLKKLPGVEVQKNGTVTVQGKKITDMLVDGKKFFGGGSKLAIENIPADAVGKIEVIDNYNEVSFLKGLGSTDKVAMNINLKEDKKNFVFGDIEVAKGNKSYYKSHANLFYYSPKTNVNFIGDINNVGEKTFTFMDYLSFQGGVNAVFKSNFNFKGGEFSAFLENKDIQASKEIFSAINITKTTSSALEVSGYAIFSKNDQENKVENNIIYNDIKEARNTNADNKNILGIGKLNLEYTPSSKSRWYARTQVKRMENTALNTILSKTETIENTFITDRDQVATTINQNIEGHLSLSNKHTLSSVIDYTFNKNTPETVWQNTKPFFHGLIPIETIGQNNIRLSQVKISNSHTLNTVLKHFWVLHRNHHIYTTLGANYTDETFSTDDKQILEDTTEKSFASAGFNNQLDYALLDAYWSMHYKFRTGIFTFKQGAELHNYQWNINQKEQHKWVVLPDVSIKIKFNKSRKISIDYALKSDFVSPNNFANRYALQSYNSVYKGNENLENSLYHNARIRYSRFSLYRGLMISAFANYTKKLEAVQNAVEFDGLHQYVTSKMVSNPSEDISFHASVRKRINKFRYSLGGRSSISNYNQEINNQIQQNKSNTYSWNVGVETLFKNFPTIEVGYERKTGKFTSGNAEASTFITNRPFFNVDYDFLKGFIFSLDYEYSDYKNESTKQSNSYQIANTSLQYRGENSAWTYKISANNIFDTRFRQSNSFSTYIISDTKTYVLPRIIMLSLSYNL